MWLSQHSFLYIFFLSLADLNEKDKDVKKLNFMKKKEKHKMFYTGHQ